jgi:aminopeptidase YwaD
MTSKKHILPIALLAIIMIVAFSSSALAVNANAEPFPFTQPNGTLIAVRLFGDEFLHWEEDVNGNLIVFDEDKDGYYYGEWTDEGAVSTGELVGAGLSVVMFRAAGQGHTIPQAVLKRAEAYREEMTAGMYDEGEGRLAQALTEAQAAPAGTPPVYADVNRMKRKMLMMHVTFEDRGNILTRGGVEMPKMSGQQIYDLCFGLREEIDRSVNGYYQDMLMTDDVVITPAEVLVPMDGCQGVIEVVMPGRHPHWGSNDAPSMVFMRDAMVKACAENLIDLPSFDTNGDGTIQTAELAIGMIIDGFEYSMGNIIPNFWGVSTSSTPAAGLTQGVKIASLFAQGAFHRNSGDVYDDAGTPGVIVHEMGHSGYSFQDTYDTGGLSASSGGLGYWSMQASGDNGRLPGEYAGLTSGYQCAYNLVRSGFVIPGTIAYGESAVMNNHLDIYLLQTPIVTPVENTPVTNYFGVQYRGQYFLLQQRKFGDKFNYDQGAFSYIGDNSGGVSYDASTGGMLIQHVDLNVPTNRISCKPGHYRAGYEEAHGGLQGMQQRSGAFGRRGDFGDLWGVNQFEFSYKSDPVSGIYAYDDGRVWVNALTPIPNQNTPSGINITDIKWDPVTMTTSFALGYKIAVSFPGLDGGTVQYYSASTSWVSLPGTYDGSCTFYPPEGLAVTAVRVVKDSFVYKFDNLVVGLDHLFLNVPSSNFLLYIKPVQSALTVGSTFLVDVMLAGNTNYTQMMADITYDTTLLQCTGYENMVGFVTACAPTGPGTIGIRCVPSTNMILGAPCDQDVRIVTLKFTVLGNFPVNNIATALNFSTVAVNPPAGYLGTVTTAIPLDIYSGATTLTAGSNAIVLPFALPTSSSRTVRVVSTMPVSSLPAAHKHGYTFEGWLLNGQTVTDAEMSTGSLIGQTLYADFKLEYGEPLTTEEESFLNLLDYDHVDYLAHYLSEEIGNRITFSARRDMCVDWLVDEFTSYGYTPEVQSFPASGTSPNPTVDGLIWIGGKHYVYYGPTWAAAASTVYKYDSNANLDITGAAVVNWANSGSALTLPAGDYTSKAVFVVTNGSWPSAANAYNAALALQNAGAAAVMFQTLPMAANGNTSYSRLGNTTSGTAITIPVGSTLHYETSGMLASLNAATEVKVLLRSANMVKNVIARLPAATPTNKTVYITAHHDTVGSGPGMNDNGSGTIMTLEMARAFKNVPFDVNLVFVIFDSEESGSMRGSTTFCAGLTAQEKADFVANYNMDMIATSQDNCVYMFMNITDPRLNTMQNAIPSGTYPNVALADNPAAVAVAKEYDIYNTTMKAASKLGQADWMYFCWDNTTDHAKFVSSGMINAVEYDWRSNRRGSGFELLYHRAGDTYGMNFSTAKCQVEADIISLAIFYGAQGHIPVGGVPSVPWSPSLSPQPPAAPAPQPIPEIVEITETVEAIDAVLIDEILGDALEIEIIE